MTLNALRMMIMMDSPSRVEPLMLGFRSSTPGKVIEYGGRDDGKVDVSPPLNSMSMVGATLQMQVRHTQRM